MAEGQPYWIRLHVNLGGEEGIAETELKTWHSPSGTCWWEFRRVADFLGVLEGQGSKGSDSATPSLSRWFRTRQQKFTALWQTWDLEYDAACKMSLKSVTFKAKASGSSAVVDDETRHITSLSTPGLLAFLSGVPEILKSLRVKGRAAALLDCLIARSCATDEGSPLGEVPNDIKQACSESRHGQLCPHFQHGLATVAKQSGGKNMGVFVLHKLAPMCSAVRSWCGKLLLEISQHITQQLEHIAYTSDPLKATPLDEHRSRKRPIDEDVRRAVVSRAASENRAATPHALCKATDVAPAGLVYSWQDTWLLEYQSCSWLAAGQAADIVVACDAKRLGSPAEETEVFAACFDAFDRHLQVWLPPVVPFQPRCFRCKLCQKLREHNRRGSEPCSLGLPRTAQRSLFCKRSGNRKEDTPACAHSLALVLGVVFSRQIGHRHKCNAYV